MKYEKLRLGLDLGSNSVGWALLDENMKIVRKNGFSFWGVRMFSEAQTAQERGAYRKSRRRINRRKLYRLNLLREQFAQEISKIDPTFFERLDDSFFKIEDKRNNNVHNLFTEGYTDKEFYEAYPTIHHLRYALTKKDEKFDIRMVFLAINHIMKHRGNFLIEGEEFKKSDYTRIVHIFDKFNNAFIELSTLFSEDEQYNEDYYKQIEFTDETALVLQRILNEVKGINEKKAQLIKLFNVGKKTLVGEFIVPLLVGSKLDASKLSPVSSQKYDKCEIIIASEDLEANIPNMKSSIPELGLLFDLLMDIKEIVDYYYLIKVLSNADTISEAMVKIYDEHQADLRKLKVFLKKYSRNKYNECFKKNHEGNYASYVGMLNVSSKMKRFKHCTRDKFYEYLRNVFKTITDENAQEEIEYFMNKMNDQSLLLRQRSNLNGSFPMQLHLYELKAILRNQAKYYPFLNNVEDGLSVSDKIISIFKFKIPYYVGVLNPKSPYSWVIRNEGQITPWNFESVVNLEESAKCFIQRMQNKCTYLKGDADYCLPKFSLLFTEYNCLSYLNKISINGRLLPTNIKLKIFEDVFLTRKQPTKKDIIEYIKANYYTSDVFTSTSKELPEINCSMSSYIKFREIFGPEFENSKDMIENIIRDITIFEDKKILENRLLKLYKLDESIVKKIKDLNYQGYGRLSKNLINGIKAIDPATGEVRGTVIEIMRETNLSLQEILYNESYRLVDRIDEYNKEYTIDKGMTLNDFIEENIAVSPSIKRAIIQSYTIIEEIEKILGRKIDEYYVECTRSNKASKTPSTSRYNRLKALYQNCKQLALEFGINLEDLSKKLDDNQDQLKSDKIYLYFTQLGRSMYSLKPIDFESLVSNNNETDIDHIYPQALIKDDSLSNRVLVYKSENTIKTDKFLFEVEGIQHSHAKQFYEKLLAQELISKEKFSRLTKKELQDNELDGFVNRQLVTTNQSVKGLIEILKIYKGVEPKNIVYSKAENVSDFRKKFDLVKSRLANNFHHAHDAYLNVIVGSILNQYYSNMSYYKFSDYKRIRTESKTLNPINIFEKDQVEFRNKIIWDKKPMISKIRHDLYERFDIHETIRTLNSNKMFAKVTIIPAGGKSAIPVKTNSPVADTSKYGGVNSNSYSRYVLLKEIDKKGLTNYCLEAIPKNYDARIDEYLEISCYINYEIIHNNIKTNVVVECQDRKYYITGKSGDTYLVTNLIDRIFTYDELKTIHKLEKYNSNLKFKVPMLSIDESIIISPAKDDNCKAIIITKNECLELLNAIKCHFHKTIYSYSVIGKIAINLDKDYSSWPIEDLLSLLWELLRLLKTNTRDTANLVNIGLTANSGELRIGYKLPKGLKLISESITGYYRKVLFEVK